MSNASFSDYEIETLIFVIRNNWIHPANEQAATALEQLMRERNEARQLAKETAYLREALEYYADPETYEGRAVGYNWVKDIEEDQGAKARAALDGANKPKKQTTKHRCTACGKMTRDTTAGCDHCDLEDK
jgi:hypothetical protein